MLWIIDTLIKVSRYEMRGVVNMVNSFVSFVILLIAAGRFVLPAAGFAVLATVVTVKLAAGGSRLGAWLKAFFEL